MHILTFSKPNHLLAFVVQASLYLGQMVLANYLPLQHSLLDCTRDTPYLKYLIINISFPYTYTYIYILSILMYTFDHITLLHKSIKIPVFICPHL